MCPLRLILIFLSATLAGYLAWKTLRSDKTNANADVNGDPGTLQGKDSKIRDNIETSSFCKKVVAKMCAGFGILVDMASGRNLWHTLATQYRAQEGKDK